MKPPRSADNELILGLVSVSDRASQGIYEDKGIPALEAWCRKAVKTPVKIHKRLIADERFDIEKTLRELVDIVGCDLILTTGGTGRYARSDPRGCYPRNAWLWRTNARHFRSLCSDGNSFAPSRRPSRNTRSCSTDSQPSRPAQSDCRNARRSEGRIRKKSRQRHLCCRSLLH